MRTPAGTECKFYYEDFHRRSVQECRLIQKNPDSLPRTPDICAKCAVPEILMANACTHLLLKATIERQWLVMKRVRVEAFCDHKNELVLEPRVGCGECANLKRET